MKTLAELNFKGCAHFSYNITSLTKNWFCYDAHFKHQQAKRWIWNGFVGV